MPRILTIFPNTENIHLIKDVGMIPYTLHNDYSYESTLACFDNGDYPYLKTEVCGLKLVFIKQRFSNELLNVLCFLFSNYRKWDIVQCYHISRNSFIYLFVFKTLKLLSNAKSIIYLKLDLNDSILNEKISWRLYFLLSKLDIISVETKRIFESLKQSKVIHGKLLYVPNGFKSNDELRKIHFKDKENRIITVGRIGLYEKNNEDLLLAFKSFAISNPKWELELIGPIENRFLSYIDRFFLLNPELRSRIIFTGAISDRDALQAKYRQAKLFVLSSFTESFGIALVEAISNGCFLLSSNFSAAYDITNDQEYGFLFESGNLKSLEDRLIDTIEHLENNVINCERIQQFAFEKYSWTKICNKLHIVFSEKLI